MLFRGYARTETSQSKFPGEKGKLACKPGSVECLSAFRQSFIWAGSCLPARATYPGTARAALLPPYLVLLRMGFAVPLLLPEARWALTRRSRDRPHPLRDTHRFTIAVLIAETWAVCSLWHFPSPRGVRSLTGILLCGARTFLCASKLHSDCPASFRTYSTRCIVCFRDFELQMPPSRDDFNNFASCGARYHREHPRQSCSKRTK